MDTSPHGLESWLQILFYLVGGVASIVVLIKSLQKEKPQKIAMPLEVRGSVEFTRLEQHNELRDEVQRLSEQIENLDNENQRITYDLKKEIKVDFAGIHDRFTQLLSGFSELKGEIKAELRSRHPFGTRKE